MLVALSSVAATSLSDIVCGFHVAGCCIETTRFGPKGLGSLAQVLTWVVAFYRPSGLKDRQKANMLMVS